MADAKVSSLTAVATPASTDTVYIVQSSTSKKGTISQYSPALSTQTANFVYCGPTTGAAANPTFRALVALDMAPLLAATNSWTAKQTFTSTVGTITTDTDASTVTFDMAVSDIHSLTLTASGHTLATTNVTTGQSFIIRLVQGGSGSNTVTWFSTIKWPGGSTPTLTTTLNKTDVFGFLCTSAGNYDGFIMGQNL
jgi:hypothetical protein